MIVAAAAAAEKGMLDSNSMPSALLAEHRTLGISQQQQQLLSVVATLLVAAVQSLQHDGFHQIHCSLRSLLCSVCLQ